MKTTIDNMANQLDRIEQKLDKSLKCGIAFDHTYEQRVKVAR